MESTNPMSQEIGQVTLSHCLSLVVTLTEDWATPMKYLPMSNEIFDDISAMENKIFNEISAMENEISNEILTNEQ